MSATTPGDVPALPPPPGAVPNFVNPYSLSPAFIVTAVLCLLLATASTIVRLALSLPKSEERFRVENCSLLYH